MGQPNLAPRLVADMTLRPVVYAAEHATRQAAQGTQSSDRPTPTCVCDTGITAVAASQEYRPRSASRRSGLSASVVDAAGGQSEGTRGWGWEWVRRTSAAGSGRVVVRAGLYIRVSTAEQVEKFSLAAQRRLLTDYAKQQGWESEIYEDAGISGETLDARPAMLRLLQDARAGKIRVAVAVEMERFSRSQDLLDWLVIKQTFRQGSVRFGTPAQLYNPADEEDDFMTDLFGALSKREKRKILARTLRGKIEAARRGRYVSSHAPYGYRLAGRLEGRVVVNEGEAETVRLIFSLLLEGNGTRTIAAELERRGIPAPHGQRTWARSTVRRILTNPAYVGTAYYNRRRTVSKISPAGKRWSQVTETRPEEQWVQIQVPTVLARETFDRAQEQLARNQALARRNQQRPYLLKGLVRCGECGRPMTGVAFGGVRYHRCQGKRRGVTPRCRSSSVQAGALEAFVWDELAGMLGEPERVLAEARRWRETHLSERDELEMRLAAMRTQLAKIPEERERVLRAYREGWVSEDEFKVQLVDLNRKRAALDDERQIIQSRLFVGTVSDEHATRLEAVLERVGRRLQGLTFDERFQVVHAFVERVIVHADAAVEIHAFVPADTEAAARGEDRRRFMATAWGRGNTLKGS